MQEPSGGGRKAYGGLGEPDRGLARLFDRVDRVEYPDLPEPRK